MSIQVHLREFVKTSVILTPGALLVGCEPQFVLHFGGIRGIDRIRRGAQNRVLNRQKSVLARSSDLKSQKNLIKTDICWTPFSFELYKSALALPRDAKS